MCREPAAQIQGGRQRRPWHSPGPLAVPARPERQSAWSPERIENFQTIVNGVLNEKIEVTENGRRRKVTKLEVIIRQLVNKAAASEIKNTTLLLKVLVLDMSSKDDKPTEQIFGGKPDEQLLADLLQDYGVKRQPTDADDETA